MTEDDGAALQLKWQVQVEGPLENLKVKGETGGRTTGLSEDGGS